jgi:hypothetical protein
VNSGNGKKVVREDVWPIGVLQQGRGKQEEGRTSIFVAEEVHVTMLRRHLCLADPARKSWEAILGSRYFGPAKVVKERVGEHSTARAKNLRLVVTWPTGCKSWRTVPRPMGHRATLAAFAQL